jgi:hypothetical protein
MRKQVMMKTLFVTTALAFSAGAYAQASGTVADAGSPQQMQLAKQQAAGPSQDNHSYCLFGDKLYSLGAKRDGQVCVPNTGAFGNEENNSPQWSNQRAGRGNQ